MLMTPALGLFYGGLVRQKNVLSTIMHSFFMLALISIQWVLWGYSLAFGPDKGGLIGGLEWVGLNGVGLEPNPTYAATIPHQAFMVYQMMFAVITPALISGAFAERKRFKAFAIFSLLWATLVYDPMAHWVWADGGWLRSLGALDFAGGTVVHITSGVSALVCALVLGQRLGFGKEPMEAHNVTMTVLGTALLWFGWFGFNAGSALGSGALSVSAFVTTNTAAAMAALTWMTASWIRHERPSVLGATAGAVAGLVGITPAAGFVSPMAALLIGFVAGLGCFLVVEFVVRRRVDDALDVFGVHGIGGILGALLTGVFATKAINPAGADGLLFGNPGQLGVQALAVVVAIVYSAGVTWGLLKLVDLTIGLRVSKDEEQQGLDTTQHGEVAYQM
jgi:Amt family ammonium transporter